MIIGIPKEVKADENRVSLTPDKVDLLVKNGHTVLVQTGAGRGAAFEDDVYDAVGASIVDDASDVFGESDMIVKVKEPQPQEYELFRKNQILFTFLHLAPEPELTRALLKSKVAGVAYETVQEPDGSLPLLYPMSEIAGRLAPQVAARLLQNLAGGPGKMMGGIPGVEPPRMVVVGGGTVGLNAALVASGMGTQVTIVDINLDRLRHINLASHGTIDTVVATPQNVTSLLQRADVAVGAVLVPGDRAPKVITSDM
ncbi:MAG: alanine dehydrogenase, partial [SAR202 cluster bacterium]|nr:alanine dehydrogenase [SAR202 cluster bacterium]